MTEPTKFQFVTTEDGSFSARIGAPDASSDTWSEAMHSPRGAFSETVYIYGTSLLLATAKNFDERVLSMGLGLGYIELLAAAIALKNNRQTRGESFEIVPELRNYFRDWLNGADHSQALVPNEFVKVYDAIRDRTAFEIGVNANELHQNLANAVGSGDWLLRSELDATTSFTAPFGCICFDAFSSKSTPDLWNEDFLRSFLQKTAAADCSLSTYACTGALKRALKSEHFAVTIREGFSSKRDSTFAVRSFNSSEASFSKDESGPVSN